MKKKVTVEIDGMLYQKVKMASIIEKITIQQIVHKAFERIIKKVSKPKELS